MDVSQMPTATASGLGFVRCRQVVGNPVQVVGKPEATKSDLWNCGVIGRCHCIRMVGLAIPTAWLKLAIR
jgi:hypothetical protein